MKAFFLFIKNWINAEKICLLAIRWGACLALFTPLVVHNKFFFPFVAPKTIFFRIIVEIILAAYICLLTINRKKYLPKITPLLIALTIFLEVFILTSLAGVNLERSFWSTYERMTGLFTMLHLYAFFIILSSCFRKKEDWQIFLAVSVLAGAVLSFYVLFGDQIHTRGGGTIGNSSFMGAYLLFDIFFALILFLSNLFKKELRALILQIFSGISLAVMLYVLFNNSARGALFFFEIGIFFMSLGYLFYSGKKKMKRIGIIVVLFFAISTIVLVFLQPDFLKNEADGALLEMKSRFTVWQISLKAWQERFLLGWGPENFYIPFSKYFNPCLFSTICGGEIWFDRAHNIIFDTVVSMGLAGLISYLAVFFVALWEALRVLNRISDFRNKFTVLGAATLLIVYFGQNLLVFDMINSYLVFFLSLAFIGSFSFAAKAGENSKENQEVKKLSLKLRSLPLLSAVILIIGVILWFGNVQPAIAAHYIVKMISAKDVKSAMDYFQKSLDTKMYKYETREIFALRTSQATFGQVADVQDLAKAAELAERQLKKSIAENPADFRQHFYLGKLYTTQYKITGLKENLDLAEQYTQKAMEISPTSQQGYWQMGEIRLAKGDPKAVEFFKKAIDLDPRLSVSYWYLAMAYKYLGQYGAAAEELLKIKDMVYNRDLSYYFNDLNMTLMAIEVFQATNDYEELITLYQKVLEFRPDDIKTWGYLAASYYQLGQFNKAREVAMQVKEKYPELSRQIDDYMKILPR